MRNYLFSQKQFSDIYGYLLGVYAISHLSSKQSWLIKQMLYAVRIGHSQKSGRYATETWLLTVGVRAAMD